MVYALPFGRAYKLGVDDGLDCVGWFPTKSKITASAVGSSPMLTLMISPDWRQQFFRALF